MPAATYQYLGKPDLIIMLNLLDTVLRGNGISAVKDRGLSEEDFTTALQTKLNGIFAGATATAWNQIQNSGTKIATITINDNSAVDVYVPTVTIDSAMSSSSENPVQNKVIKEYVDTAVGAVVQIKFDADTTGQGYTSLTDLQTKHPTGANGTIYLVQNTGTGTNTKDEYFWDSNSLKYERFGSTDIDLSNYVTKDDIAELSTADVNDAFHTVWPTVFPTNQQGS